jgi:hypothetical protein
VFILKGVKVVCFDTLLQVLILKIVISPRKLGGSDLLQAIQENGVPWD